MSEVIAEPIVSSVAGKWAVDVAPYGTTGDNNWTRIRGVQEFAEADEGNLEDDSDYDSAGWKSEIRTGLGWNLEATVKRGITEDPGQAVVRAAARRIGLEGNVRVRWFDRNGGPEAYEGIAVAGFANDGGAVTDLSTATIMLNGRGPAAEITNPAAGSLAPQVSSIDPEAGGVAGGQLVTITGSGFTGATAVKFGAANATDFDVISDTKIAAISPAKTAGNATISVTTAKGTSTGGPTFVYA